MMDPFLARSARIIEISDQQHVNSTWCGNIIVVSHKFLVLMFTYCTVGRMARSCDARRAREGKRYGSLRTVSLSKILSSYVIHT
jgi:hypothetical protein